MSRPERSFPKTERAVLTTALWDELEDMGAEEFRALLADDSDPRWDVKTTVTLAGAVCKRVGLIPYGPDFPKYMGPAHWQRFYNVPVIRVHAFIRKYEDQIESSAGRKAYLERWSEKYSPAFADRGKPSDG